MQIANNNLVARVAAVVAGLGLVASSFAFAPAANAQSTTDLQAQIAALMAQIAALQAQAGGSASANASFNRDLTIGATGADVTALQNWLIKMGFAIPAGATGYFGGQTQAALAKYQASVGITPAAGYFGPMTRAKVNAAAGGSTGGNTGGQTGGNTNGGDLQGGAGSVDSYELMASLNTEEVGEDEEDVEVAGLEIEADDGSDLEFTAVRLVFDESTGATSDFEEYASEVSVWFDGEEVGRVDADEFNDDNDWTKTISLDGAILEAGETGELTVAVSGQSTIDSGDQGDMWTVDLRQVRFVDADGATVSEDPSTNTRTFSFTSFASAADVELKIEEDDMDINDARTVEIDASDDTDDVEVLSFTMEAEGDSDLDISSFVVSVTSTETTGNDPDDLISALHLIVDGEEVGSETLSTADADNSMESVVFDDLDWNIGAGDTAEVVITADFYSTADTLDAGDTVAFTLGETETDSADFDVEDEAGENLTDADITGSVSSGDFELRDVGIMVTLVSVDEIANVQDSADNDTGTFTVKVNVESFGGTVYVASSSQATTASSVNGASILESLYRVDQGSSATTTLLSDAVSYTTTGGASLSSSVGNIVLTEGEDTDLTFTVTRTNSGPDNNGLYRMLLKAIAWNTADTYGAYNIYDFNLEDFKTDYLSLD